MIIERKEQIEKDLELITEVLRKGGPFLGEGVSPEKVSHKLGADRLAKKGEYWNALPHYESFGEVPDDIVKENQISNLSSIDQPTDLEEWKALISKYGNKLSQDDVEAVFVRELQNGHSFFLTGPANRGNCKSLVARIEEETGVKFVRSLVRKAYLEAIDEGYRHRVENVFENSKGASFKPKTHEEYDMVNKLIKMNVKADSLATPKYVCKIPLMTGVSPSYQLLLDVGRKKAREVTEKKLHPSYMKDYIKSVESIGLPVLGNHLRCLVGMKPPTNTIKVVNGKSSFVKRWMNYFRG